MQNDHKFISLNEKLDVQFISRSDKYRETCRSVFKPKQVEERDSSFSKAHSKILKQEFRDEKAETGTRELQGQLQSNSRNWPLLRGLTRERVQLHEELSLQEGALREIRIEGIQVVEELKRQFDELFSQN